MPIYEYQCTKCDHEFEVLQKMSDDPITECEECGELVEKLISQSSFYIQGYAPSKDIKNKNVLRRQNEKHRARRKSRKEEMG